ncbi:hypothetical protein BD311DRAFT_714237 [Dichomitus squalens]|uniref:DUF6593 domain-containing protein n=1 Tax=Dichomitus squalens TaxID=114155 RepID=A0A4Q9MWQ6_9APHY|nr:hypothetical protein BD311DRAFT_714237 [Dichomitus squalens]
MSESSPPTTTTLTLTPDDVLNATLCDGEGTALYFVSTTPSLYTTTTQVTRSNGELLATVEWRDMLPNRLRLGKKPPTTLNNWLQTALVPFASKGNASFKDDSGRKYKWQGAAYANTLELFTKDDGYEEPIATFTKSRKNIGRDLPAEPARLALTARAVEIQDTVVLSFLFLERLRRGQARTRQSTADALSKQPIVAITSGHGYGAGGG